MLSNITYGFSQYHIIAIDSDEGHILELNFPQICSIDWALPLAEKISVDKFWPNNSNSTSRNFQGHKYKSVRNICRKMSALFITAKEILILIIIN